METVVAPPPSLRNPTPLAPPPPTLDARHTAALEEAPLLPPVLAGPAAFLWLWALPIAVLLALNLQGYALIEGNMAATQRAQAWWLGFANVANLAAGVALFFVTRRFAANRASPTANLILRTAPALGIQIGYLWLATTLSSEVIPASVAQWIYPPSRFFFYQFSFAMLPLFAGILHLACARANGGAGKTIAVNLGLAIGAPLVVFVLVHGTRVFNPGFRLPALVIATGMIALGVTMFVALVRALMIGLRGLQRLSVAGETAAIVLLALLLPIGGLALNRAIPFPVDFQAWEVYALTLANAAILLLAAWRHAQSPRLSIALLCASFPFSLYFFFVFLPYTPLSIIAVLAAGAGFLVLAPTALFVLHLYQLNKARHALAALRRPGQVAAIGALSFLVLPAAFVGRATADRTALNAALDHVYSPAISGEKVVYPGSVAELRRALSSHRSYKNGIHYPLLSDFYAWWVFNNLVLSDDKLARLEQTFLGTAGTKHNLDPLRSPRQGVFGGGSVRARASLPRANPPARDVVVRELAVSSRKADEDNSVVSLVFTLQNRSSAQAEYTTRLPLPAGVFVNGFRLHINGEPVPGRIFEKKTALWVYTMIRDTERRDPGLLFYRSPEELELRVFPIEGNATAVVEVDFLAPGEIAVAALPAGARDPVAVLTALEGRLDATLAHDARGSYLSLGRRARALPDVNPVPYVHLIVDRSLDNGYTGELPVALREVQARFPAVQAARITLAHHDVVDLVPELTPVAELSRERLAGLEQRLPASGGLALDVALAHAIRRHRDLDLDRAGQHGALPRRPIFVVLSKQAVARELDFELTDDWLDLVPGFELHEFTASGAWIAHRAAEAGVPMPVVALGDSVRAVHPARAVRFARATSEAELRYWSPEKNDWQLLSEVTTQPGSTLWSRAVAWQLQQQDYSRSPGNAGLDLKTLVKASRETGVLLPGTSYIVVENAAQWRMLERSERQKLTQNAALDFLETPAPPVVWVGVAFAAWLGVRRWRRRSRALAVAR